MGPMRTAKRFVGHLKETSVLERVTKLQTDYGSSALTGMGHGTDRAIVLGLSCEEPGTIDPATIEERPTQVRQSGVIRLLSVMPAAFCENETLSSTTTDVPAADAAPEWHALYRLRCARRFLDQQI